MSPRSFAALRRGLALCYFALLCVAVLAPQPDRHSTSFTDNGPFVIAWLADVIRNVLLFAPLGVFVSLERASLRRSVLLASALAIGIELLQTAIPGRFSSPVDVVSNGLGAALGALGVRWTPVLRRPPPRLARGLALACPLGSALLLLVSTALLVPVVPEERYFGGFTPDLRHLSLYSGEVLDARLDDLAIPAGGPVAEDAPFPSRLRGRPTLSLSFRAGSRPPSLAPLVTLHDAEEQEVLLIGLDGDDLVARRGLRAVHLGFENPVQRWAAVMAEDGRTLESGAVHTIEVRFDGPIWQARFDGEALADRRWTAGRGWALVVPIEWIPTALLPAFDVAWIALLGLPAAYHAGRGRRSIFPLAGVLAALAGTPYVGSVAAASAAEWAGLLGAMAIGLWLRPPSSDATHAS